MNSYGDHNSGRGRAQLPGFNGDDGPDADAHRRSSADRPPAGRAQVGRAQVGRAGVPRPGGPGSSSGYDRPAGRASVGSAAVGAASVGGAGAAASGRATVGRASVRPVSPGGPRAGGPGGSGPGGPGGPGRRSGRGGKDDSPAARRKAKRRKRINWLIASFAVFIMLAGAGVVGGTYYSTTVVLPEDLDLPLASTLYYADGKKELARLGEFNRTFVKIDQIPDHVEKAVAAAEDRNFYKHSGVDYAGIARAAWNNLTGGTKQGASTITQQYAKNALDLQGGYARKVREAVLASKLNEKYSKDEIMQHYLNTIYFGRGAYGIEAASQAYFEKSVEKLDVAEGAVLAAVIKQPEASAGHKGYDPGENLDVAKDRWNYVLGGMVDEGWLAKEKRPTEYPEVQPLPKDGACFIDCGIDKPTGNVINYLKDEFVEMKLCDNRDTCIKEIKKRGYRITTTIDSRIQAAAEAAAWRAKKGSVLDGQPKNLMAAVVAIDPKTGRVLAYFGGSSGVDLDYAGRNGVPGQWTGGHPPGSTFKIYTLAAALKAGKHVESYWKVDKYPVPGTGITVRNSSTPNCGGNSCTLEKSTISSYNVPFYHVTTEIGPDKVVDIAKAAGITTMWDTFDDKAYDLTGVSGKDVAPKPFFNVVGYGQYPITVLDQANGIATFANRGMYHKAHFVKSVELKNPDTGEWEKVGGEQLKGQRRIEQHIVDDVTSVLEKIPRNNGRRLANNRPVAGKTGTWEDKDGSPENGDAWMVGYTPQIAAAVWVGNLKERKPLRDKNGNKVGSNGLPSDIWQRFMNDAHKGMKVEQFADRKGVGDPNSGNGESPPPPAPPPTEDPSCIPFFGCPPGNGNGNGGDDNNRDRPGRGGDGGGGGGGGGGSIGLLPSPSPTARLRR